MVRDPAALDVDCAADCAEKQSGIGIWRVKAQRVDCSGVDEDVVVHLAVDAGGGESEEGIGFGDGDALGKELTLDA